MSKAYVTTFIVVIDVFMENKGSIGYNTIVIAGDSERKCFYIVY